MTLIDDLFTTLLFGSGSWIGLLLILLLILIMSHLARYLGKIVGVIIGAYLGVEFLQRTETSPYLAWNSIIMFLMAGFLVIALLKEAKGK